MDIDQEDWLTIDSWIKNITDTLSSIELALELDYLDLTNQGEEEEGVYTRTRPLMAEMIVSIKLYFFKKLPVVGISKLS